MASLDFTSGSVVAVHSVSGTLVPTRALAASRLVPVSRISRYDTALVAANDHFICYPTAKSGVVRVISQEDASHLTLVSGGLRVRGLALSAVGAATWVSALVELDGGAQRVQSWRLANGPLSEDRVEARTAIAVAPGRHVSQIEYAAGSTVLVAAFVGDDATPSLEAYDAAHAALVAHQACLARVADLTVTWTAQAGLAVAIALMEDGTMNVWNLQIEQQKYVMYRLDAPPVSQPQAVSVGGLVMFDRKLGVLNPAKLSQFKGVIDFKSALKPRCYRLLHFQRQYAIVVDTANSQLIVVKIDPVDSTLLSIAGLKMPAGVELLDVAVTRNLDGMENDAFDAYIFHSKGLSILQVTQDDLAVDGSAVLRAATSRAGSGANSPVPAANNNNNKKNSRKKPQRSTASDDSIDYDRIVEAVAKKLLESGQFVSQKRFDELQKRYDELASRINPSGINPSGESPKQAKDGKWAMGGSIWGPIGGTEQQHGALYSVRTPEATAAASGTPSVAPGASPSSLDGDMLPLASSTLSPAIAARKDESPIRGLWGHPAAPHAPHAPQTASVASSPAVSVASPIPPTAPNPAAPIATPPTATAPIATPPIAPNLAPTATAAPPILAEKDQKPVEQLVKELVAAAGTETFNATGARIFAQLSEQYSPEDVVATSQIYVVLSAIAGVSMLFRDLASPKHEVDARIKWLSEVISAVSKQDLGDNRAVMHSTLKKVSEEASKYLFEIPTAYMAISPLKIKIEEITKS